MTDLDRAEKQRISSLIDTAIDPARMSPKDALEFLEELTSDIEGSIEAPREEQADFI